MAKFHNVRTTRGSETFDSRAEADDYTFLRLREMAGEISDLKRQVTFTLLPAFTDRDGKRWSAVTWRADFTYIEDGKMVIFETKGRRTPRYEILERLYRSQHPDVRLIVHSVEKTRRTR